MRTRYCFWVAAMLVVSTGMMAQTSTIVSVGVQAGTTSYRDFGSGMDSRFGYNLMLEVAYRDYYLQTRHIEIGYRTGGAIGTTMAYYKPTLDEHFVNYDYEGTEMDYSVTAGRFRQHIQTLQIDLPLLFSLRYDKRLVADCGIKLQVVPGAWNRQTIEQPRIAAYYPEYGVEVVNEVITGLATDEQLKQTVRYNVPVASIVGSVAIGYEFPLRRRNRSLGLQAYCDLALWGAKAKETAQTMDHVVTVTPVTDMSYPVPEVEVTVPRLTANPHNLSAGIRLYYSISY